MAAVARAAPAVGWVFGAGVVWEVVARSGLFNAVVFPDVSAILGALWRSAREGEIFFHLGVTLVEIIAAFTLASVAGVAFGLAMGFLRTAGQMLQFALLVVFSFPFVTLVPFFVILFGLGMTTKIVVASIYGFFPISMSTVSAVRTIDPTLYRLARALGASRLQTATKFLFPAALPGIVAGLEGGISLCVIGVLATEMLASAAGVGYLVNLATTGIQTGKVYGLIAVTLVLAYGFNRGVHHLRALVRRDTEHA